MEQPNFDEIKVFADTMDDMDIIRNLISEEYQKKAFYIADIGKVIQNHKNWIAKMPKVVPHFAMKCNPDPTVVKVLVTLNGCFDCASESEIRQVMQHGVHGDRIIFAHPAKYPSHIMYAKEMNVKKMTVDSEPELFKIKDLFPEAQIVLRIRCDSKDAATVLGLKFGSEPGDETIRLIQLTKDLGLNLHGFSFHVGSPCGGELEAYGRGIAMCKQLITISKEIGFEDVQLIDIGGGFPGECETNIDKIADIINDAIQDLDTSIRVISEPGSYYVTCPFTLISYIHSKRIASNNGKIVRMYFMNCGIYHSFLDNLLNLKARIPQLLFERKSDEKFISSLWGPTADTSDVVIKDILLPELNIGDWLVWKNMGAYTIAIATTFNGFPIPAVIPIMRKNQWLIFTKKRFVHNHIHNS